MEYAPPLIFALLLVAAIAFILSKGGLRGAFFGSKITTTVGEVYPESRWLLNFVVRVHKLENSKVALEITSSRGLSFSLHGCTLDSGQAKNLARLLDSAS
jgi:hypothetical protein